MSKEFEKVLEEAIEWNKSPETGEYYVEHVNQKAIVEAHNAEVIRILEGLKDKVTQYGFTEGDFEFLDPKYIDQLIKERKGQK